MDLNRRCRSRNLPHELKIFNAQTVPSAKLLIHGTADIASMGPVIEGFQRQNPDIEVDYRLYETVPLYESAVDASNVDASADLLVSSAMDLQVKLANDGHVQPASIIAARGLPDWAIWRNEIFGFTLEPAVIVYNPHKVPANEVPRSHQDLVRLLEQSPEKFRGKIATYDIAVSGVGYLFATTELMLSANFWRLTHALRLGQDTAVLLQPRYDRFRDPRRKSDRLRRARLLCASAPGATSKSADCRS